MRYINDVLSANEREDFERQSNCADLPEQPLASGLKTSRRPPRLGPSRFRFEPDKVLTLLQRRIVGQDHVLAELDDLLQVVKADLADPARPLYVALLAGPTGVGKSGTVALLAEAITGRRDAICRIDMNTLAQEHYSAALTGAPPGYVGSKEGHTLFHVQAAEGDFSTPGIVLFDEIEKASPEVVRTLLNIMEEGQLRLSSGGHTINFRNSLIFMTTNLGGRELLEAQSRPGLLNSCAAWCGPLRRAANGEARVRKRIEASFDPEFINRIDRTLMFRPLQQQHATSLVAIALEQLNLRLMKKGWQVTLSHTACAEVGERGFDRRYGARGIRRAVRSLVETPLSRFLLQEDSASCPPQGQVSGRCAPRQVFGGWRAGEIAFQEPGRGLILPTPSNPDGRNRPAADR